MKEEDWILHIVSKFYDKAKNDILIGYHFRNIQDFDEHIPRIASFWDFQLLGKTSRDFGNPFDVMGAHSPLGIKRGELDRWLLLLRRTLDEQTPEDFLPLKQKWLERLNFFNGVFSRFFGL
ncbi:MAG: hypothetical protein AB7I27_09380 [Bacteriovoracaceae bacterium]